MLEEWFVYVYPVKNLPWASQMDQWVTVLVPKRDFLTLILDPNSGRIELPNVISPKELLGMHVPPPNGNLLVSKQINGNFYFPESAMQGLKCFPEDPHMKREWNPFV